MNDCLLSTSEPAWVVSNFDQMQSSVPKLKQCADRITVIGAPGAGKTSLARKLAVTFNAVLVNIGSVLSQAMTLQTAYGLEAKGHLEAQSCLPEDLLARIIIERLSAPDCRCQGWILDGFPRCIVQVSFHTPQHTCTFNSSPIAPEFPECVGGYQGDELCVHITNYVTSQSSYCLVWTPYNLALLAFVGLHTRLVRKEAVLLQPC